MLSYVKQRTPFSPQILNQFVFLNVTFRLGILVLYLVKPLLFY